MSANLRIETDRFYMKLQLIQREIEEGVDKRIENVDLSDGPGLVAGLLARRLFKEFVAKVKEEKLLENEAIKKDEDLADRFIRAHERYFKGDLCDKIEEKLEKREKEEDANKVIINP